MPEPEEVVHESEAFRVVCPACFSSTAARGNVEINFSQGTIHMVCPSCKKSSTMIVDPSKNFKPLPRTRLQG